MVLKVHSTIFCSIRFYGRHTCTGLNIPHFNKTLTCDSYYMLRITKMPYSSFIFHWNNGDIYLGSERTYIGSERTYVCASIEVC